MIFFNKNNKKQNGYTIIELIFYISFFVVLSLVLTNTMLVMIRSFKETAVQTEFIQSGTIMERISREIRQATSIGLISSTDLLLSTTSGTDTTIEFKLSGTNLQLLENGTLTGNLNPPNIIINNLSFTQITTLQSKAVKVVLTLKSSDDPSSRSVKFYDTIVLRGSY